MPKLLKNDLPEILENAVFLAEKKYSQWSGRTMRTAPESLVQTILAESLYKAGAKVVLEQSFKEIIKLSNNASQEDNQKDRRRLDIAIFFENGNPRILIEIKKLNSTKSLHSDCKRIQELLQKCPSAQCGFILAYGTSSWEKYKSKGEKTLQNRISGAKNIPGMRLIKEIPIKMVNGRDNKPRVLGGAIFIITPPKSHNSNNSKYTLRNHEIMQ